MGKHGFAIVMLMAVTACGYSLQRSTTRSPWFEDHAIKTLLVMPMVNNTYKPGAEHVVYNNVVKTLLASKKMSIVHDLKDADAILYGVVNQAGYAVSGTTGANSLYPRGLYGVGVGAQDLKAAIEFSASLGCSFQLVRAKGMAGKKMDIWSGAFGSSKPFPASSAIGVFGNTSTAINESEFDRALRELAVIVASDMHESMFSGF